MLDLNNVTLLGVDCVDIERLIFAAEVSQKHINFKEVKLLTHLDSNYPNIVKIDAITSVEDYSEFMITQLDKYVETDYVLIIQYDGFVLNPEAWTDTFFNYDYIGAPTFWGMGNGGFSFRSKKLLKKLAKLEKLETHHPEDMVICTTLREQLERQNIKFAPDAIAEKFSVENKLWNQQFGFHNSDISQWQIEAFTDANRHKKHIDTYFYKFRNPIKLSYVVPFYFEDTQVNPIQELIDIYSSYDTELIKQIHFVFVDDHSKQPYQIPENTNLNYTLVRVTDDIMWNQGGARNLGVTFAMSDRLILTDLDIVFPENLLQRLINYNPPNNSVFKFNTISNFQLVRPHVNVFFTTKQVFMKTQGVDEEFCGNYGYEDIFFYYLQKALGTKFYLYRYSNIVHKEHKESAKTQHNPLIRDVTINEQLIHDKLEIIKTAANPMDSRSDLYLNFNWEVLQEHTMQD